MKKQIRLLVQTCQAVCQPFDGLALLGLMASIGLIAKHQAQQPIHQTGASAGAAHRDVRYDAHVALADDLHELHHGVALRAERFDTGAIRFRFAEHFKTGRFCVATSLQSRRQ